MALDICDQEVESDVLRLVSSDARRDIYEYEFTQGDCAFQDFTIRDTSKPVGQHFHKEKFEIFYFISGGGRIRTARVSSDGKITDEIKIFVVSAGSAIRIPPYHTHRFDLVENTRFVAFSSRSFDPTDMIACPIVIE